MQVAYSVRTELVRECAVHVHTHPEARGAAPRGRTGRAGRRSRGTRSRSCTRRRAASARSRRAAAPAPSTASLSVREAEQTLSHHTESHATLLVSHYFCADSPSTLDSTPLNDSQRQQLLYGSTRASAAERRVARPPSGSDESRRLNWICQRAALKDKLICFSKFRVRRAACLPARAFNARLAP